MKKIAIIGTRGIPASYSGFETSVQETSIRFVKKGFDTTVFCRKKHYNTYPDQYQGVKLIYLSSISSKHFDTLSNSFLTLMFLLKKRFDYIILYGVGNSIFIPLLRLMRYPVISVVDGADWERKKWGVFAKFVLKISRIFAVKFSNNYVVDNELLVKEYEKRFNKKAVYIPYGANSSFINNEQYLAEFGLVKHKYIIFVGRFVKEKGIDFLISNYEKLSGDIKLVIVGDNSLDTDYVSLLKSTKDNRIVFPGFLYGEKYETLLHNALFYVSCSYLEGTSPSLLSAMAINGFALVSDLSENIEVLKSTCATFKVGDPIDFQNKMKYYLSNTDVIERERTLTRDVVRKYYNWDRITEQYLNLLLKIPN